jgi:hypothetical protein
VPRVALGKLIRGDTCSSWLACRAQASADVPSGPGSPGGNLGAMTSSRGKRWVSVRGAAASPLRRSLNILGLNAVPSSIDEHAGLRAEGFSASCFPGGDKA